MGLVFPFDFGFIPGTRGEDGDPIDVLLLMDAPAFTGCLVSSRLLGDIEAEQTEDGQTVRNDRLIAVATDSYVHRGITSLGELSGNLVDEIEHFFKSYTSLRGKLFEPIGRYGPERASKLVKKASKGRGGSKRR